MLQWTDGIPRYGLLSVFFAILVAAHKPRFLQVEPAASLLQAAQVYHSLEATALHTGGISQPSSTNHSEELQPTQQALQVSPSSHQLCLARAVNGCQLLHDSGFVRQVEAGKVAAAGKGIILAGLMRDDGAGTGLLLDSLQIVGNSFARHHLILLENDSKDGTRQNMSRVCQSPHAWCFELKLSALGPQKQNVNVPHRVKHLTWLRQHLLEQVHRFVSESHVSWDFLLMFDGDLFSEGNAGFNPMATLAMFGFRSHNGPTLAEQPPDVVCANGIMNYQGNAGRFRDTFALRLQSFDETHAAGKDSYFFNGNQLIDLKSCFSGLALYSLPGLLQSHCGYTYESEDICEHVVFHRCLARKGRGRVAVYPPWTIRFFNDAVSREACSQQPHSNGTDECLAKLPEDDGLADDGLTDDVSAADIGDHDDDADASDAADQTDNDNDSQIMDQTFDDDLEDPNPDAQIMDQIMDEEEKDDSQEDSNLIDEGEEDDSQDDDEKMSLEEEDQDQAA